jgi:tRNA-Thr(GGU) m(6)t(6)A37 methyltransferase TsaA
VARKDYVDAVPFPDEVRLRPIGVVRSPYRQRFGTPRQAVVTEGTLGEAEQDATIELNSEVVPAAALGGLDGFERMWIVSLFHLNQGWNPTVVPPRGPRVRRGVLATRAPHRPNHIGLSCVRVIRVEGHVVHVRGIDLLDGTPVLDLKPYVPYADAFPDAAAGWLDGLTGRMDEPDRPTRPPG